MTGEREIVAVPVRGAAEAGVWCISPALREQLRALVEEELRKADRKDVHDLYEYQIASGAWVDAITNRVIRALIGEGPTSA